jgi:hypothetical protein
VQVDLALQWPNAGCANDAAGDAANPLNLRIIRWQNPTAGLAQDLSVGLFPEGKLLVRRQAQLLCAVTGTLSGFVRQINRAPRAPEKDDRGQQQGYPDWQLQPAVLDPRSSTPKCNKHALSFH